jgi:predicted cobalt transporter CbtA
VIGTLLVRGLLVGLLAGLLAGGFAFAVGEPQVDHAIAVEAAAGAKDSTGHDHISAGHASAEAHLVSRDGQKAGLFLALALYGCAVGGLFGLVYAGIRGRITRLSGPALPCGLAGALFVAVVLVPFLKYPANPPAVGDPQTISARTSSYLLMVAIGLVSLGTAAWAARSVRRSAPGWARAIAGGAGFLVPVVVGFVALPTVDEVPSGFPASLLWDFRLASLGTQVVFWACLGAAFALATERATNRALPRSERQDSPVPS